MKPAQKIDLFKRAVKDQEPQTVAELLSVFLECFDLNVKLNVVTRPTIVKGLVMFIQLVNPKYKG